MLFLGVSLPNISELLAPHSGVIPFLAIWAAAALSAAIIGIAALFGLPGAINLIGKTKGLFSPERKLSAWIFPVGLSIYLLATTAIILVWGADNPFLIRIAEPLGRWFFLAALQALLVFFFISEQKYSQGYKKPAAIILAVFALVWLLALSTRIGLEPDNRYWNVAGVPVLMNQLGLILLLALFGIFLYGLLTRMPAKNPHRREILLDFLACLILFAGAAWFWQQAPFSNSFFAEGKFPPNQDFYPYSDAALTDLGGQYMLIGKGLEYPYFTEKPLYALFLGLLHKFVGQNYLAVTSWQMIFFAVFPVLLYLLGKQLHNRLFGLSVALFSIAKEYNAIFSTFKISVSNSRLYLSEFPTMILMALLAIALVAWFKRPDKMSASALLAGGVLGLAVMVRTNPLLLIPTILLFALWVYRRDLKRYWSSALLFLCGILLVLGPWLAYTRIKYGTDPFAYKISAVIQTRFQQQEQELAPTGLDQHALSLLGEKPGIPEETQPGEGAPLSARLGAAGFTLGHFLNNEIKALFTLPFAIYPLEITPVLDLPYWEEPVSWRGELPLSSMFAFALNLTLIGLGIAASWKNNSAAGLVPLVLNLGYYASNALGRTSGSRYLLPVDWTLYFYFLLPLILIYENGAHLRSEVPEEQKLALNQEKEHKRRPLPLTGLAMLLLLMGSAIPLINLSFPDLYTHQTQDESKVALLESPLLRADSELVGQSEQLLEKHSALLFSGRMLYPRYRDFVLNGKEGLILTVLRPELTEVFFSFDTDDLTYLDAGKEIIVLGCQREAYVEAFAAYLPEQGLTLRSNIPDFISSCP
ncbi:MAG: hypothetical protein AAGU04_04370 [Anaerolineaceae bacterium]